MKQFAHKNVSGVMDVRLDEGHIATIRRGPKNWDFNYHYNGWGSSLPYFWSDLGLNNRAIWEPEHLPLLKKALRNVSEATLPDLEKLGFRPPIKIDKYEEGIYTVAHDIWSLPVGVSLRNTKHFFAEHVKKPSWSVAANWQEGAFQKVWGVGFCLGPEFDDLDPELSSEKDKEKILEELRLLLPPAVEQARATASELLKGK
jgi:hypothetical protein